MPPAIRERPATVAHTGLSCWIVTGILTVAQMMEEQDLGREATAELEIPLAELQRIVGEMMDRQYHQVLDEPVTALDNKTPRQMARTKAGRAKVVEWLKYIENMTAKSGNGQMAGYNFAWMWDELGVADLRSSKQHRFRPSLL